MEDFTALRNLRMSNLIWIVIYFLLGRAEANEVCYETIGCFSDKPPWSGIPGRQLFGLPASPEKMNISFSLFTKETGNLSQKIMYNQLSSVQNSNFSPLRKTRFVIHGYTSTGKYGWVVEMCLLLVDVEDINCFAVDWEDGAKCTYFIAGSNIRVLGAVIAKFIITMMKIYQYCPSNVHLIGHSLGAHTAGEAGRRLQYVGKKSPAIERISEFQVYVRKNSDHQPIVNFCGCQIADPHTTIDRWVSFHLEIHQDRKIKWARVDMMDLTEYRKSDQALTLSQQPKIQIQPFSGTQLQDYYGKVVLHGHPYACFHMGGMLIVNYSVTPKGLDPAAVGFEGFPEMVRLDPSDAGLVDVIHSNGVRFPLGLGMFNATGDMDFYPNGGKRMVGCNDVKEEQEQEDIRSVGNCHHSRSHEYYKYSIVHPSGFLAYPCKSYKSFQAGNCFPCPTEGCPVMGHYADQFHDKLKKRNQTYYLNTGSKEPFTSWRYNISVKLNGMKNVRGEINIVFHNKNGDMKEYPIMRGNLNHEQIYSKLTDVEINPENASRIEFVWHKQFFTFFWAQLGAEKVNLTRGQDGRKTSLCGQGTVKYEVPQMLTPCGILKEA